MMRGEPWGEPVCGPVRCVGWVRGRGDGSMFHEPGVITVGNRVKAWWQDYGHLLGTGTVIGFEADERGWIKVVVDSDRPDPLAGGNPVRWDWDRTERVPGHYDGETQEESIGRLREFQARERSPSGG